MADEVLSGEPRFRARQFLDAIYQRAVLDVHAMSSLPRALREALACRRSLSPLCEHTRLVAADGTVKWLFSLPDGATLETVLIPTRSRRTLCVSTQVGCAMGCRFCASGLNGFARNLSAGEIVAQLLHANAYLAAFPGEPRVDHLVVMGMGEPLLNFEALIEALERICDPALIGLGARRITVSTVGIPARIRELARRATPSATELESETPARIGNSPLEASKDVSRLMGDGSRQGSDPRANHEPQTTIHEAHRGFRGNLALSLHAPDDELRAALIPPALRIPLHEVLDATQDYFRVTGREVTFEYVLLGKVNDQDEHARALVRLLRPLRGHVNLIPFNPVPETPFHAPRPEDAGRFRRIIELGGIRATIRRPRGVEVTAACGQLRRARQER